MPSTFEREWNGKHQNWRTGEFFKCLSPEALSELQSFQSPSYHPDNTVLFLEMQRPVEIFIILEGQAKLCINSSDGKRLILHIAGPGEILGLASGLSGNPYDMTAETLQPCYIVSIHSGDFLRFLMRHPSLYANVARELSQDYSRACERLRTVGLASSAPAKLARLLLEWVTTGRPTERGTRLDHSLTHEEIGECIGASRETVTRTLSDFKNRQLVNLHGSSLTIPNRLALEQYAGL